MSAVAVEGLELESLGPNLSLLHYLGSSDFAPDAIGFDSPSFRQA